MPRATKATPPKKAAPKKAVAKKAVATKAAAVKKPAAKKAVVKKATPAKKPPVRRAATTTVKVAKAPAPVKKAARPVAATPKAAATPRPAAPVRRAGGAPTTPKTAPKKVVLDKFLLEQRELLQSERARHVEQAQELKAEADQLAAEREPGDVQFDEESGEGGTTNIDRERDLALSMQAQAEVEEVDHALAKIEAGTYGACEHCGQAIPKARLKAIPQARLCIACKSGGLSRR